MTVNAPSLCHLVQVSPQLLLKLAGQDLPESAAVPDGFSRCALLP